MASIIRVTGAWTQLLADWLDSEHLPAPDIRGALARWAADDIVPIPVWRELLMRATALRPQLRAPGLAIGAMVQPRHVGVMGYVVLASTNLGELTLPEGDRVGYLLFNDHILPATDALTAAVRRFQTAGISDLVLDLRYNGGGFLSVASRLAYMLSGPATDNQTFFRLAFNDKHRDDDYNFGFMNLDNQDRALPRLNLKRVYVIIDSRTCSASEAVINGLRPFLPVYTIGSATCGKPYGFIQTDYCDKTYFAVRFQGANRDGESVPETGFSADCPARDDPDYALGEPGEAMLASALTLRRTGACPRAEAFQRRAKALPPPLRPLPREPWRDNLIAP